MEKAQVIVDFVAPDFLHGKYKIYRDGKIVGPRGWEMSQGFDKDGYKLLTVNYKKPCGEYFNKTFRSHRIVAMCFIPNPDNKPLVNHKNGIKHDNRVDNLEWVTVAENNAHARKMGLVSNSGEKSYSAKIDNIQALTIFTFRRHDFYNTNRLADHYGLSIPMVGKIKRREKWKSILPGNYL